MYTKIETKRLKRSRRAKARILGRSDSVKMSEAKAFSVSMSIWKSSSLGYV